MTFRGEVRRCSPYATTLAVGLSGAVLFLFLGLPVPAMLGPMAAIALAAILGFDVRFPAPAKTALVGLCGVALGETFTPAIIGHATQWSLSFALVMVSNLAMAIVVLGALRWWARYDRVTAYYAAIPGALTQILILAPEAGADMPTVGTSHGVRVLLMMLGVPAAAAAFAGHGPAALAHVAGPMRPWTDLLIDLPVLACLFLIGQWLGARLRLPGHALMGPLVLVGALSLARTPLPRVPDELLLAAQFAIGAAAGIAFVGTSIARLRRLGGIALAAASFMLVWCAAAASGIAALFSWPLSVSLLLLAPGGLAEMGVVALAYGIEPDKVAAHQSLRTALMAVLVPLCWQLLSWRQPAAVPAAAGGDFGRSRRISDTATADLPAAAAGD